MKLVNVKSFKDEDCWRCKNNGVNKHDIKINIRINSVFNNIKTDIRSIHFIIYYNIVSNFSFKQIHRKFTNCLKIKSIRRKLISKIHFIKRLKIMKA